jgi:hypothetical protein
MNHYVSLSLTSSKSSVHLHALYSRQTMRWSLRGVNILSAVRGEYRACRWTQDFLLVSVVNHSLTANIGQFGFWRVSAHLRALITGAVKIYLSLIVNI